MIFPKIRKIYSDAFVPGEGSLIANTWLLKKMEFTFFSDTESIGYNTPTSKKQLFGFLLF